MKKLFLACFCAFFIFHQSDGIPIFDRIDKKKLILPVFGLGYSFFYLKKKEDDYKVIEQAIQRLLETSTEQPEIIRLKKELSIAIKKKNLWKIAKIIGFLGSSFFLLKQFTNQLIDEDTSSELTHQIFAIFFFIATQLILFSNQSQDESVSEKTNNTQNSNPDNHHWKVLRPDEIDFNQTDVSMPEAVRNGLDDAAQFIKNPEKFAQIKQAIPKGFLFTGPPGCGKTLTAKAFAASTGLNFIGVTGSEFVHLYVGTGSFAIKSLFQKARENAPCMIFIDEIDSIARTRSPENSSGELEYDRTLNQLLFELDGQQTSKDWDGVVVFAATNLIESVDKALLRPGRLGKILTFEPPNLKNRVEIFKINLEKFGVKFSESDILSAAKQSIGMNGAQIRDIVNQAAIRFIKTNEKIENLDLQTLFDAIELVQLGQPKEELFEQLSLEDKKRIAVHESGHAMASFLIKKTVPAQIITIIPRVGGALGQTLFIPDNEADQIFQDQESLEAKIMVALGGMAAEKVFYNNAHSSGVSDDLIEANKIARILITRFGMSELGPISVLQEDKYTASNETKRSIDELSKNMVNEKLKELIELFSKPKNREAIEVLTRSLLLKKTLNRDQALDLLGSLRDSP